MEVQLATSQSPRVMKSEVFIQPTLRVPLEQPSVLSQRDEREAQHLSAERQANGGFNRLHLTHDADLQYTFELRYY
jgi:hypothetical protein